MKKIVIQIHMDSDKCRSKALKIAAVFPGVNSVSIEGEDRVVVTGDGIDSVCLTNQLRKKFRNANLMNVEDAKASNAGGEQQNETMSMENSSLPYYYWNYPQPCPSYHVVYDPYPNSCSIL